MAREFILGQFDAATAGRSAYVSDFGTAYDGLGFRFRDPGDITEAEMDNIFIAIQAIAVDPGDRLPCSVGQNISPRKIQFIRADGNSFTLPMPVRGNIITAANAVIAAVGRGSGNPVVCAHLIGETTGELIDTGIQTRTTAPAAGIPSTANGKQPVYSGKYAYQYDGPAADSLVSITHALKVDTDLEGLPPTVVGGDTWTTCVGTPQVNNPCPTRRELKHRRFIVTFLVNEPGGVAGPGGVVPTIFQRTEVPATSRDPALILGCAAAIADLASTVCLQYRGESRRNYHTLLALA